MKVDQSLDKPRVLFLGKQEGFVSREIMRGVLSMRAEGYDWEFWCMTEKFTMCEIEAFFLNRKVDGIIARDLPREIALALVEMGIPTIFLRGEEDISAEYINGPHSDDTMIGRIAGDEFSRLNLGYWGFVHWDGVMWSEERMKNFSENAVKFGVQNEILSLSGNKRCGWYAVEEIARWLSEMPKPCGVLACNDDAGLKVLNACRHLNLRVPEDVAVIGVDNDGLLCESGVRSLSSIDLRVANIGRSAVLRLGKMIGIIDENVVEPENSAVCVLRESSQKVDLNLLIYQKALDFLKSRPLRNTKVEQLAKGCGVSRRGLERAFEKCGLAGPAVLIRERRIAALIELLEDGASSIESLSEQAGFSDAAGLSNFVKRMTGRNPGSFRRKRS